MSFSNFTLSLILHNDLRDPIEATLYSVYANSAPIPYSRTLTLAGRDQVEIRFSDVLRDSINAPEETETEGITVRKFADLSNLAGS